MYEANFEFNTNTIEFDSEINTKDIQASLILNITPDRTSQLINDSDYTTNEALNNAVDVLDERIDNIDINIEAELDTKQDKLTAGANIQINNNVISATDTTYTAGDGIAINGNVISNTRTSAEWGNIQGDIEDQTDLVVYIDENGGKIDVIQKNGTTLPITDKTVNITVPTDTSDLTNGAGYITNSALNGYATESWVENKGYLTSADLSQIESDIEGIQELIPNQASTSNQLADKNFVNSSIATNTANFIGTFNSVAELEAYSGTLTNNDYAFVVGTDSAGNTVYDRYKYNADTQEWLFEYELNNSSFTASQWAAINSGITSGDVSLIQTALQSGDNITELVNNAGYISGVAWGDVTGTLSSQTDLQNALNSKQNVLTAGTNITIDSNNIISSTAQESFFRGNFNEWSDVPTNTSLYQEDIHGNRIPKNTDFIVIEDASQFIPVGELMNKLVIECLGVNVRITDETGVSKEYNYTYCPNMFVAIDDYYSLQYIYGAPGRWYIKTNDGSPIVIKGVTYQSGQEFLFTADESGTVINVGMPPSAGQYQGAWRFAYYGVWATAGLTGWTPQYKIENTLPIANETTFGIAKLYNTTGQNTDGSMTQKSITDALGGKQNTLTAGANITINANNVISSTAQESFFRGKWNTWSNVPTDASLYPVDIHGNHKPLANDFLVVTDASGYVEDFPIDVSISVYGSGGWETFFTFTMGGETKNIQTGTVTFSNGVVVTVIESSWAGRIIQINRKFKIGSTIYPKDTNYDLKGSVTSMKIASENPTVYQGSWRFYYDSNYSWDTNGKNGWKPQYQIEDVLPIATNTVAGITKLYTTTGSNTDGAVDQATVTTELGGKQDVISDLATIRSGAGLGATALQPNDNISELNNDAGYTTNVGTVTSVNNVQPDANGNVTITTYIHEQGIASDIWTINHNLGKYPSVSLVDSAGIQFQGRVEYINENTCKVYMNGATKGKAFLN